MASSLLQDVTKEMMEELDQVKAGLIEAGRSFIRDVTSQIVPTSSSLAQPEHFCGKSLIRVSRAIPSNRSLSDATHTRRRACVRPLSCWERYVSR